VSTTTVNVIFQRDSQELENKLVNLFLDYIEPYQVASLGKTLVKLNRFYLFTVLERIDGDKALTDLEEIFSEHLDNQQFEIIVCEYPLKFVKVYQGKDKFEK